MLVIAGGGLARASGSSDEALARPSYRHPVQNEQFYFVMPDRFENGSASNDTGGLPGGTSDEDVLRHGYDPELKGYYHGGDIAGLREKLDYLDDMGVSAVWMTPMFKNKPVQGDGTIAGSSAGYHGYWITDFTRIDPHMGTNRELRSLKDEAHDRGMKVFFDIITNHTADVIRYKEGQYDYISKAQEPYRTASGKPFDDRDYAGTDEFPELDPQVSFPYTPVVPRAERDVKSRIGWTTASTTTTGATRTSRTRTRTSNTATSSASTTCSPSTRAWPRAWWTSTTIGWTTAWTVSA